MAMGISGVAGGVVAEAASTQLAWWQAAILGLVEGITEYLPISSTGHLILASGVMGLDTPERKGAVDAFTIIIQGGAILAVLGLYWPSVLRMIRGVQGKDQAGLNLLVNLVVAFIPAAVLGLLLDDLIEGHLFAPGPVILALALGGVYMMVVDWWSRGRLGKPRYSGNTPTVYDLSLRQALFIGCMQCVAMWPGTSRSMMTITGGMLAGLRPRQAAEFSFLLGLPTLGAATLYKLGKDLWASHETGDPNIFVKLGVLPCIVGIAVAAVSAAVAVRWLVGFLNRHGLMLFGWYRLVLAAGLLLMINAGVVRFGNSGEPDIQRQTTVLPAVDFSGAGLNAAPLPGSPAGAAVGTMGSGTGSNPARTDR